MSFKAQNNEEAIVYYGIAGIWIFYFTGLLYVVGSAIGWVLCLFMFKRFIDGERFHIHFIVKVWIIGMLVLLLTVIVGHLNFNLSTGSLIKSMIGWGKGWALLAIFPLIANLPIRFQAITAGITSLCKQTLWIVPILVIAGIFGLPSSLYSSPLKFLANPSFFEIELYGLNASTGLPRWRLFTPWGPALGLYGNMVLAISLFQDNKKLKFIGITCAIIMVLLSQSRMGMLCLLALPTFCIFLVKVKQIKYLILLAVLAPVLAATTAPVLHTVENSMEKIHAARSDSSRVRGALERIAIDRWQNEAPIWGHGVVEKGSHFVEYMPIGSHHTWLGLLFVKGIVGLFAMLIPLVASLCWTFTQYFLAREDDNYFIKVRTSLHILLILCAYSLTENLEILAYLHWPTILFTGLLVRESIQKNRLPNE